VKADLVRRTSFQLEVPFVKRLSVDGCGAPVWALVMRRAALRHPRKCRHSVWWTVDGVVVGKCSTKDFSTGRSGVWCDLL